MYPTSPFPVRIIIIVIILMAGILTGQIIHVDHPYRAHLDNICWSADSKMIAYESIESGKNIAVYVFDVQSSTLRELLGSKSSGPLPTATGSKPKVRQPRWGTSSNNLFFLYNDGMSSNKSERLLGLVSDLNINKLPLRYNSRSKGFDGISSVYKSMKQGENNIAEYHILTVEGGVETYFLKYSQSPNLVSSTNGKQEPVGMALKSINDNTKAIDSFALSSSGGSIAIVAGNDKEKRILIGDIRWRHGMFMTAKYYDLKVNKNEFGVLQEASFNPANSKQLAYLEFTSRGEVGLDNELVLVDGWTDGAPVDRLYSRIPATQITLKKNIYRNEKNKIARPNCPSYVWHPDGTRIFIIDRDRNVGVISLNGEVPYEKLYPEKVVNAEQLAISPDGESLAVLTQVKSKKGKALSEIIILPLK